MLDRASKERSHRVDKGSWEIKVKCGDKVEDYWNFISNYRDVVVFEGKENFDWFRWILE